MRILETGESFDNSLNRALMTSELFYIDKNCEKCNKKCIMCVIKKEFNNVFPIEKAGASAINNLLYQILILKFNILKIDVLMTTINEEKRRKNEEKLQKINKETKEQPEKIKHFNKCVDDFFSEWQPETFEKIKILIKYYRDEQIKSISHPCPYKEK